jgi:hypothetical protein
MQRRVVLCGDSLLLAAMRASLDAYPSLEVITLAAPSAAQLERVVALDPAAVIFDGGSERRDRLLSLLQERPDLLLIQVDVCSHGMLVLSGRHLHEPTTLDLVQLIVNVNSHNRSLDEGMSDEEDLG